MKVTIIFMIKYLFKVYEHKLNLSSVEEFFWLTKVIQACSIFWSVTYKKSNHGDKKIFHDFKTFW